MLDVPMSHYTINGGEFNDVYGNLYNIASESTVQDVLSVIAFASPGQMFPIVKKFLEKASTSSTCSI